MNWTGIHPKARGVFQRLEAEMVRQRLTGETPSAFAPFEGHRGPNQQEAMRKNAQGVSPWESPHQYGLALRFGVYSNGAWSFDALHDWKALERTAYQNGLIYSDGTVIHPLWNYVRRYFI